MQNRRKKIIAASLSAVLIFVLFSCTADRPRGKAVELMPAAAEAKEETITCYKDFSEAEERAGDFSVALFQQSGGEKGNVLLSPVSLLMVLGMTAQGAEGETLSQMEQVFGCKADYMSQWLEFYREDLCRRAGDRVKITQSVWIRDQEEQLTVEDSFLRKVKEYFAASVYKAPFDSSTVDDINDWCEENTQGMIDRLLENISNQSMLYLINAVAFESRWQKVYEKAQIHEDYFINEAGERQKVDMMTAEESIYLENEMACGFAKPYQNDCLFVAILPKEGVSMEEYIGSMTGESFRSLLQSRQDVSVETGLPQFEIQYGTEFADALRKMGLEDLFDEEKADLSGIGKSALGNLFISRIIQKTYIEVKAEGTRAAAVTSADLACGSAAVVPEKQVILNRPFLYAIVDCQTQVPLFLGTVKEL